jgi:hypothetical protein
VTTFVEKILDVHRHLEEAGIDHAFGGALCLGYHVESPRATVDIDVNVTAEPRDAARVLRALPAEIDWDENDVAQIERDGQARVFWDRTPVDLFFPQHELHSVVAGRAQAVPLAGSVIPVLSATDLTVFKALFDRPKDWVDIAEMLAYGEVDVAEVRRWLAGLVGADDRRVERFDGLL